MKKKPLKKLGETYFFSNQAFIFILVKKSQRRMSGVVISKTQIL